MDPGPSPDVHPRMYVMDMRYSPTGWVPATCEEDADRVAKSQFQLKQALDAADSCGVNQ